MPRAGRGACRPAALLGVAAVVLLAGCTQGGGSGAVKAVPFDRADTPICQAVSAHWPGTVGGLEPRVTAVQTRGVAAWGDPPVVARCGKQAPPPTTDQCLDINGIDWVATPLDDGAMMFTTYGRDPALEVLVPAEHESPALLLPAFGEAAGQVEQTLGECVASGG